MVTAESLGPVERASFDSAGIVDDASAAGPAWFGRAAVGDITLGNAARGCLTGVVGQNSFSGDTLVAFADGRLTPVADVQVGDQMLAYDFDIGETVGREVTATLPHTDWLLEAHFSDGSTLTVTEDHRFWSVTDTEWVELQHLDTDDILLTPDGVTVTVDYLDWNVGADAAAWDLTVAEEHNFFVAADDTAEPVLVHNQTPGFFCPVTISFDQVPRLLDVQNSASPSTLSGLRAVLEEYAENGEAVLAKQVIDLITNAETLDGAVAIARSPRRHNSIAITETRCSSRVPNQVLTNRDVPIHRRCRTHMEHQRSLCLGRRVS